LFPLRNTKESVLFILRLLSFGLCYRLLFEFLVHFIGFIAANLENKSSELEILICVLIIPLDSAFAREDLLKLFNQSTIRVIQQIN